MQFKTSSGFAVFVSTLILATPNLSFAGSTSLADWCVNLNGDINTACNGAGSGGVSPGGGSIDLSGFDTTLSPAGNVLGTIVVNLVAGENDQFAGFYADYDLDFAAFGSFQDSGSTSGAVPAGVSYELADPNVSNIFSDFSSLPTALPNSPNVVGSPSTPGPPCCDVATAIGVTGLDVAAGGTGTVTFTVSTAQPTSGFFIQQTNVDDLDSIYISESTVITNPMGGGGVPEPSTFLLGFGVLGLGMCVRRFRAVRSE